jgi:hypothetical protein
MLFFCIMKINQQPAITVTCFFKRMITLKGVKFGLIYFQKIIFVFWVFFTELNIPHFEFHIWHLDSYMVGKIGTIECFNVHKLAVKIVNNVGWKDHFLVISTISCAIKAKNSVHSLVAFKHWFFAVVRFFGWISARLKPPVDWRLYFTSGRRHENASGPHY